MTLFCFFFFFSISPSFPAMPHPFRSSEIKCLMLQLLAGVAFMHENWILHRDLVSS